MEPTFWHGGAPRLRVGEILTPGHGSETARAAYSLKGADHRHGVYLTSDVEFARAWAATWAARHGKAGDGSVYRVQPLGDLCADPDYPQTDLSWFVSAAEILAVEASKVRLTTTEANRRALCYATWTDGTPAYDADGHPTIGPDADPSLTVDICKQLPPWTDVWSPNGDSLVRRLTAQSARRGATR